MLRAKCLKQRRSTHGRQGVADQHSLHTREPLADVIPQVSFGRALGDGLASGLGRLVLLIELVALRPRSLRVLLVEVHGRRVVEVHGWCLHWWRIYSRRNTRQNDPTATRNWHRHPAFRDIFLRNGILRNIFFGNRVQGAVLVLIRRLPPFFIRDLLVTSDSSLVTELI